MNPLNVVFQKYDDGSVGAECLEIPGCVSDGDTEEEARANIADAIEMCRSVIREDAVGFSTGEPINITGTHGATCVAPVAKAVD